jgi:hypothetical protein
MIWDVLNALVGTAALVLHTVYAALPQSPIYVPGAVASELVPVFQHLAWFFPITGMLIFLGLYFSAVFVLATVLLLKQLIEAIIP